jgi:trichothecene 3-O-acetyltransferase
MLLPTSYEFGPLDEVIPPLYHAIIYGFPCEESQRDRALEVLQGGFTRLLKSRPYMGGDIVRDDSPDVRPGSLKLVVPDPPADLQLAVVDLSSPESGWKHSYDEVREAGMPLSWLDPALVAPYTTGIASTTKVLMGQVNWIPGGCLFTMYIAHALTDAWGGAMVVQYWAQECREFQGISTPSPLDALPESNGRHPALHEIPSSPETFDRLKGRPELWKLLGLHWEENLTVAKDAVSLPTTIPAAAVAIPGMRTCIFSFTPEACSRLKADAKPSSKGGWISTQDALVALIWRSVMRARLSEAAKPGTATNGVSNGTASATRQNSIVSVAIEGRSLCKPKVPYSIINNVVYCCMTEMPVTTILDPDPSKNTLSNLALAVRSNIEAFKSDPVLVNDTNQLAASIPDVGKLSIAFKDFLGYDLITTSWIDAPFYQGVDFGPPLGKPDFMRLPKGQFSGICSLQPRKANGDIEAFISLNEEEMERFFKDEEFKKYADFVCV